LPDFFFPGALGVSLTAINFLTSPNTAEPFVKAHPSLLFLIGDARNRLRAALPLFHPAPGHDFQL
jgi:hypothetical protein